MSMIKTPRMRRLHAAVALLALAASMMGADGAFGQVRAAYTKNVDEPGRQRYEQIIGFSRFGCSTTNCTSLVFLGGAFRFDAPPVAAGKLSVISQFDGLMFTYRDGPTGTKFLLDRSRRKFAAGA